MYEQFGPARPRGTDGAKVIQVIETRALEGSGTEDDPCRTKVQYWSFDGKLLGEGVIGNQQRADVSRSNDKCL